MMTRRDQWSWRLALVAVLALAAWLRVTGLAFGLPAVYNPDEIAIMSRALAFATGDLNPHNFLYPTFYFYVLFAWIGAWFAACWVAGLVPSLSAFQTQFFVDPSSVYLAGVRWASSAVSRPSPSCTCSDGALFGPRAGLAAALFLAVAPAHVRDSHYVKHDVPATLAIVAALLAIVAMARLKPGATDDSTAAVPRFKPASPVAPGFSPASPPRLRTILLAGAACGVAFSTHYYAVFLVVPLALAVWHATRAGGMPRDRARRGRRRRCGRCGLPGALALPAGGADDGLERRRGEPADRRRSSGRERRRTLCVGSGICRNAVAGDGRLAGSCGRRRRLCARSSARSRGPHSS